MAHDNVNTAVQYDQVIASCKSLFLKKTEDYGTAWRILRLSSLTDQIYIKAARIRSIEIKKEAKIQDGIQDEFIGIINYCIISLMQLELGEPSAENIPVDQVAKHYQEKVDETKALMLAKNHDYGEAWRDMRISSLTDLILMKLHRVKQIEDNQGVTLVSEGLAANYQDMLNYAVFALIKMDFAQ